MNNTISLYDDRKSEIDFYYSIMQEIETGELKIRAVDNSKFLRISKSNFLLMLYNMVEACVISGMMEIYENLKMNAHSYSDLINELRVIWSNHEIRKVFSSQTGRKSYENRIQEIINQVISNQPIILHREVLGIGGNFDAKKIKDLCDKHRIRYIASDKDGCLRTVKDMRNNLAHGDESFGNCARDMTLSDLEHIKNEVCIFLNGILVGMKNYYDGKQYLSKATL